MSNESTATWLSSFVPLTSTEWGEGREIDEATSLGFYWGPWLVVVERAEDCPSDLPYCGFRDESPFVCLLPRGHDDPHLPCSGKMEAAGVRYVSMTMKEGEPTYRLGSMPRAIASVTWGERRPVQRPSSIDPNDWPDCAGCGCSAKEHKHSVVDASGELGIEGCGNWEDGCGDLVCHEYKFPEPYEDRGSIYNQVFGWAVITKEKCSDDYRLGGLHRYRKDAVLERRHTEGTNFVVEVTVRDSMPSAPYNKPGYREHLAKLNGWD